MKTRLKQAGVIVCFIAVLAMNGGHWLVLQSVAWTRMIVEFSQQESLGAAIVNTFSGRHPCSLCLQIHQGRQQEQQQEQKIPVLKLGKMPELFWEESRLTVPPQPASAKACTAYVCGAYLDYLDSPPTPPPRASMPWL